MVAQSCPCTRACYVSSVVSGSVTPWAGARRAPLSMDSAGEHTGGPLPSRGWSPGVLRRRPSPPPGGRAARWGHLVAESAPVSPAALTRARGAGNAEGDPGDSAGKNHLPMQETGLPPLGPEGALPCSCLGRPMDRGAWRATAHGVTERDATVPPNKSKRSKHELKQPPGQAPACSPR